MEHHLLNKLQTIFEHSSPSIDPKNIKFVKL
jgi:hypothetical protein